MSYKKLFTVLFIAEYVILIFTAVLLWVLNRRIGPFFDVATLDGQFLYIFGIVCAISVILGTYLAISRKIWSPILRLSLLTSPAILVLIDWLMFGHSNMVYCLPFLAVASFMVLKNVYDD